MPLSLLGEAGRLRQMFNPLLLLSDGSVMPNEERENGDGGAEAAEWSDASDGRPDPTRAELS